MAYFLSFIALFLFAEELTAKQPNLHFPEKRLFKLNYRNSSGEIAVTTFYYDKNGRMNEAFWECTDGSKNSKNYYRYNNKDQLISAYRIFSDDLTSYEIFLYDEAGRKVHETFLRSDGVTGTADYIYDKKGRRERVICDHYKGWISGDIVYKKNKKGLDTEAEIIRDAKVIGRIVFEYDEQGLLIRDTWTFEGGFTQTFEYVYEEL